MYTTHRLKLGFDMLIYTTHSLKLGMDQRREKEGVVIPSHLYV